MQGSARPNRTKDRIRLLYRCETGTSRTITAWLDHWLREVAVGQAEPGATGPSSEPEDIEARIAECDLRFQRLLDAVETATLTHAEIETRAKHLRSERADLEAQLSRPSREAHDIRAQVEQALKELPTATATE